MNYTLETLRSRARYFGEDVAKISEYVLSLPNFSIWSACVDNKHHYGKGGLLRHTGQVVDLIDVNGATLGFQGMPCDKKIAFLGGLFHDVGKLWDYEPVPDTNFNEWRATPHKRIVHHISRSGIVWSQAVADSGLCKDIETEVLHCILSHHGLREWGSPVFPKTREAWLVHFCDSLSARFDDCGRVDLVHSV